jgi:hypothetical protein
MNFFHDFYLGLQLRHDRLRHGHSAGFIALSPDRKHSRVEIEIYHPQADAFIDAKPAASVACSSC